MKKEANVKRLRKVERGGNWLLRFVEGAITGNCVYLIRRKGGVRNGK